MTTAQFLSTAATLQACADLCPKLALPEVYSVMAEALKANPNSGASSKFYAAYRKGLPEKDMRAYLANLNQLDGLPAEVLLYAIYNYVPNRNKTLASPSYKKLHKAIITNCKKGNYAEQQRLERNYNPPK